MASNSGRRSGSSGPSTRKRVVIGADETVRVRYRQNSPEVESERRGSRAQRTTARSKQPSSSAGKRLSSVKRGERERRQRTIRTRRVVAGLGLLLLMTLCVWGAIALYNAPLFVVKNVEVEGTRQLTRDQVLRKARLPEGATLLRVPVGAMERRLASDPWIDSVAVTRDFPSTIRIRVTERRPAAIVDAGGTDLWVVSEDLFWLGIRSAETTTLIPIVDVGEIAPVAGRKIRETNIVNAVRVLSGLSEALRERVRAVSAPSIEETALRTAGDVEIFIGEATELAAKDRIVQQILSTEKKVVYINVRVTDRPTWRGLEQEGQ